jgi:hypothetical protein
MRKKVSGEFNILILFLGLLLGFFLGSSAVYWHFDRQNDRFLKEMINQMASLFKENTNKSATAELANGVMIKDSNGSREIATNGQSDKSDKIILIEKTGIDQDRDSINDIPENFLIFPGGESSITNDQTTSIPSGKPDELSGLSSIYSIAQDRLLYTRRVVLSGSNDNRSNSEKVLDSLLGSSTVNPKEQVFFLEFWESPLNSLGYRMGKNKIVFYGIRLYDFASITRHQGKIYLRYLNDYYPLEVTTSFKPLIPLNDPYLVEQLQ